MTLAMGFRANPQAMNRHCWAACAGMTAPTGVTRGCHASPQALSTHCTRRDDSDDEGADGSDNEGDGSDALNRRFPCQRSMLRMHQT